MKNIELASPTAMSAGSRAAEITAILAAAIIRTHPAPATKQRAVSLAFLPRRSVHTTPSQPEKL